MLTHDANTPVDILKQAQLWLEAGQRICISTVIETWGSAPQGVGSMLVVNEYGDFFGSVSGGCVENAVIEESFEVINSGQPRMLEFGVSDESAWSLGLACGGTVRVRLERFTNGPQGNAWIIRNIVIFKDKRRAIVLVTRFSDGRQELIDPVAPSLSSLDFLDEEVINRQTIGLLDVGGDEYFFNIFMPKPRLIIVGAVHIAQVLAPLARIAGFESIVIDHRKAFATVQRFPSTTLIVEPAVKALKSLRLDSHSAIITLTHNPDLDDPALSVALRSNVFYIGALGSRRTHSKRLQRLEMSGFSADALSRIHGPAGLDIGARGPAEIAVSVVAEIISEMRRQLRVRSL